MPFIVYARRLEFVPDPERHTVAVVNRLDRSWDLLGNVDAVIDESLEIGISRLTASVRQYVERFVDVREGKAKTSDFKLIFCRGSVMLQVVNGRYIGSAESPGVVVSDCKL